MKRALLLLPLCLLTSCGNQEQQANTNSTTLPVEQMNTNATGDMFGLLETNANSNAPVQNGNVNDQGLFTASMEEKKGMEGKLKEAQMLKEEVMKMNPSTDKQAMLDKIAQIKAMVSALKESDVYFIDADSLEQELIALENRMANTVQASTLPILVDVHAKFPKAAIQSLTKKGDSLYALTDTGMVGPLDATHDQMKEVTFGENVMGNKGSYSLKYRELFVAGVPGGMMKVNDTGVTPQKVEGGVWFPAKSVEAYGKSLYILDALKGQLLKYDNKADNVFLKAVPALEHPEIVQGTIQSFTIDGNIYVLMEGGKLMKFTKGEKKDITVDIDTSKLSRKTEISTNVNSGNFYIFDGEQKKFYKMKKLLTGLSVAKEYGLPQVFTTFQVSSNEKKAYFSLGSQVFTLDL